MLTIVQEGALSVRPIKKGSIEVHDLTFLLEICNNELTVALDKHIANILSNLHIFYQSDSTFFSLQ